MNPFRSFRGRLLIFGLCISLIPIAVISILCYLNARSALKRQIMQHMTAVAESRKAHIIEFLDAEKRHITYYSSDFFILDTLSRANNEPFSRQDSAKVLSDYLSQNKKLLDPHINAIEVIDAAGITIASTNELMVGRNIAEHEQLAQNIDNIYNEPYISTPHDHLGRKVPKGIDISAPIIARAGGKPLGLLINHYDLDVLNEITSNRAGMGETGEIVLGRRSGDDIIFLNSLRYAPDAPLGLSVPLASTQAEPMRLALEGKSGALIAPDYRGVDVLAAYQDIPTVGWGLVVKIDESEAFAPIKLSGIVAIILGSVCAVVVTVVGIIFAFSTARPINALRDAADRFASGDLKSRAKIRRKDEIGRLANSFNAMAGELDTLTESLERRVAERTAELVQSEEQIKASLSEKEELLKEIHHRVKNNLQIISSLLNMSRMQTGNEEANRLLTEACSRVSTMALIHSQLYQSDRFDRIDMDRHLRETTNSLLQLYGQKKNITIDIKASGVYMPVSQAIPCALALNELISNALEHAYKDRQEGTLEISMQKAADDTVSIRVRDDGIGIPEGIDPYKSDSLGLKLVRNLVQRQLKGELRYEVSKGTEFIIEFKVSREDGKEVQA